MSEKYFPIKTDTACQFKWAWSTIFLNRAVTRSCHRTAESELTPENFLNFHNTPLKQQDRAAMLNGQWPESSCTYCKKIELAGGVSDRIRMNTIPGLSPNELDTIPNATNIKPTILEIYFNNTCNLGCLYCIDFLSSTIQQENARHGRFESKGVVLENSTNHYRDMVPLFWQWFEKDFKSLRRLHVAGGEPFYQKEFDKLLDMIEQHPNPNCELNLISNLMVDSDRLDQYIQQFDYLVTNKFLKRVDITCSIDCWGDPQEYVRWKLKLSQWEKNFNKLINQPWLTININQVVTPLTIKTMPDLLEKLAGWRQKHPVGHYFSAANPAPAYLELDVFGYKEFESDIESILNLMPDQDDYDRGAKQYMQGIFNTMRDTEPDPTKIENLVIFLNEKDRRRGTNWRQVFPWIQEYI